MLLLPVVIPTKTSVCIDTWFFCFIFTFVYFYEIVHNRWNLEQKDLTIFSFHSFFSFWIRWNYTKIKISPVLGSCIALTCSGHVHDGIVSVSSYCRKPVVSGKCCFLGVIQPSPLALKIFSPSFPHRSLIPERRGLIHKSYLWLTAPMSYSDGFPSWKQRQKRHGLYVKESGEDLKRDGKWKRMVKWWSEYIGKNVIKNWN